MPNYRFLVPSWVALLCLANCGLAEASQRPAAIELINNQPFPIRMPVVVDGFPDNGELKKMQSWQQDGTNAVIIANLGPKSAERLRLDDRPRTAGVGTLTAQPTDTGLSLRLAKRDLGSFEWDIIVKPLGKGRKTATDATSSRMDFDQVFHALSPRFARIASGPLFEEWKGQAARDGLTLNLSVRVFAEGFLDLSGELVNTSASVTSNLYAAVVCRWEQRDYEKRSICNDNHVTSLGENAWSTFREGDGRHLYIQRGVDWTHTEFKHGSSAAWLNDFAPSFTVLTPATPKTPQRYTGANLSQLGQEVQTVKARLYSITEIAHSNVRSFRDRLKENIIPPIGEKLRFNSRIVFGASKSLDTIAADHDFVAWTSYNPQVRENNRVKINFGTPGVRFGTSYFPYSTLGENFDRLKLPGMDRESFWPLAADTVNQCPQYADEIRRDLRIAKAMGFELIRLHHLELLAPIDEQVRLKYLDFLFDEMRHLGLKALLDVYASPAQITSLLQRYGDAVDGIELENEVLIWGIPTDRPQQWQEVYAAVKKVRPEITVHLTGYNNTGMFDRLEQLQVPFDQVGLHSYIDTLEAIPSARGYALALSSYANKTGKAPVITEWNWRGLTKLTEEARAKIYPGIIEAPIATRGIKDFYQFQFNETLCPNPRSGRGNILRHYELLHLSRRPKAEALVLAEIIRRYSAETSGPHMLQISHEVVVLDRRGSGTVRLKIQNTSSKALNLRVQVEADTNLNARIASGQSVKLAAGKAKDLEVQISGKDLQSGFYHVFVRFETDGKPFRYGWIEARMPGKPKSANPLPWNGRHPIQVIYGADAPPLEVETAIAIAETFESASGVRVDALSSKDYRPDNSGAEIPIIVGSPDSNPLLKPFEGLMPAEDKGFARLIEKSSKESAFVISGKDSQAIEDAGMNFILDYWKGAKDSAARKSGLVQNELPRGGDATKLP
jgi:hypothetical protein